MTVVFRKPLKGRFQVTIRNTKRKPILVRTLTATRGRARLKLSVTAAKAAAYLDAARINSSSLPGRATSISIRR